MKNCVTLTVGRMKSKDSHVKHPHGYGEYSQRWSHHREWFRSDGIKSVHLQSIGPTRSNCTLTRYLSEYGTFGRQHGWKQKQVEFFIREWTRPNGTISTKRLVYHYNPPSTPKAPGVAPTLLLGHRLLVFHCSQEAGTRQHLDARMCVLFACAFEFCYGQWKCPSMLLRWPSSRRGDSDLLGTDTGWILIYISNHQHKRNDRE